MFRLGLAITAFGLILGCKSQPKDESPTKPKEEKSVEVSTGSSDVARAAARPPEPGKVMPEVSLKADRSELADLRKDIPEEVKTENDENATIARLFAGGEAEPQKIRERFEKMIRKSREKMDQIIRKKREDYSKKEKKKRDEFQKKQADLRKTMSAKKIDRNAYAEFDREQDSKRRDYFANERDDRKEFESEIAEQRHTYEDYAREKRADFEQLWREYKQSFDHRKRELEKKKEAEKKRMRMESRGEPTVPPPGSAANPGGAGAVPEPMPNSGTGQPLSSGAVVAPGTPDPDLEDFKKIPKKPGYQLTPGQKKDE